MNDRPALMSPDGHAILSAPTDTALAILAERHRRAGTLAVEIFNAVGGEAEGLWSRLPRRLRQPAERVTARVLHLGLSLSGRTRGRRLGDAPGWANTSLTGVLGALGGLGGLPTAMAELPVATLVVMRAIQGIAQEYGFDPASEATRKDCLQIMASGGPLSDSDDADLGFIAARATLTGASLNAMLTRLAPRIAAMMGQRLASRAVPVIGAAAGAAVNASFTRYYQEMAHVYFGLRRMAEDSGTPMPELVARLQEKIAAK